MTNLHDYATDDWPALPPMSALIDTVHHADIFELCGALAAGSVDMILCDLPYGTTACWFDEIIPFDPMWTAFKRAIKPGGAIVLTGSQPFTTKLIASNMRMFRYEWIWEKSLATGYLNANRNPMKAHENVLIFYDTLATYNPQMVTGKPYRATSGAVGGHVRDKTVGGYVTENDGERFPRSVLKFDSAKESLHPTQKPVDLFRYLIRTYTRPGELVFDPTCGSGTTAYAARSEGRHYIVGDSSLEYVGITNARLDAPHTPMFPQMLAG